MKELSYTPVLIAIDHGYGQMKTTHCVFPTGIQVCFGTPVFAADLLEWAGRKYIIGIGHKEVRVDKTADEDFHLLTMAAIAKELELKGMHSASVYLALGLPVRKRPFAATWVHPMSRSSFSMVSAMKLKLPTC